MDTQQDEKRLNELALRAARRGDTAFTHFLDLNQIQLARMAAGRQAVQVVFCGGYENAERCMAAFYAGEAPQDEDWPIQIIRISWRAQFGSPTHRDLLGALMALGLEYGDENNRKSLKSLEFMKAFREQYGSLLCKELLGEDGMLIITADHGCDPAYPTTDHTRERVPLLVWGLGLEESKNLGERKTFADVSATVLEALGCPEKLDGTSFYRDIILDD